jgi:hypothetical protein
MESTFGVRKEESTITNSPFLKGDRGISGITVLPKYFITCYVKIPLTPFKKGELLYGKKYFYPIT